MFERIVLTCEHASNRIPEKYSALFRSASAELDGHRGYDLGALVVARILARKFDLTLHAGTASRLLIDLNRSVGHSALFSEFTRGLQSSQKEQIIGRYYTPYREAVEAAISEDILRGCHVLHLSIHSFAAELGGRVRTADVGLLYDPGRAIEARFCDELRSRFGDLDPQLIVRRNYPYRGTADGLTTYLRTVFPARLYAGIEFEFNQRLVAEIQGGRRMARIAEQAIRGALSESRDTRETGR